MARLPGYENQRSISTGSEFMRPRSTRDQTGAAMGSLGSSLASVGNTVVNEELRIQAKAEADQNRIERIEAERDVLQTDSEARILLQQAQENIHESGKGFYDSYMQNYDSMWQERLAKAPEKLQAEMELKYMRNREHMAVRVSAIEQNQRNRFVGQVTQEKAASLSTGVQTGMYDHVTAKAEADAYVDSLVLPPNAAALAKRQLGLSVDAAFVKRQIALNPDGALRDLKQYSPGAMRAAPGARSQNVQTVIEAAERNGVPADVMLAIVKGESGFDHTTDMSKKINPATGRPYSSAYGLGQMIDGNWKEVGLQKSADPVIQAEATARLIGKRIATLQSQNLPVTPENVWGMHLVGPGAYPKLLNVSPSTPLRDVLLPAYGETNYKAATTGNGALLKDGATVGETLQRIKSYVDQRSTEVQAMVTYDGAKDGRQVVEIGGTKLGYMTGQDAMKYVGTAQQAVAEAREAEMKTWQKQQVDDGIINAFNRGDRKTMDKYAETTGVHVAMNQGNPEAYGQASAFVAKHKYLPKPYAEEAAMAILSPDKTKRQLAYDLLASVEVHQPMGGLRASGVQSDIAKRVEGYIALKTHYGMTNSQAMAVMEREFSPEFQDMVRKDKDRVENIVRRQNLSKLEGNLNTGTGWFFQSTEYGTEAFQRAALNAYQDRVRFHLNDGAGEERAVALAQSDMSKAYGPDETFGAKRMMHWPPSKVLPTGKDGTHKWVSDAVTGFVNDSLTVNNMGFKVKPTDVYLIGSSETARSMAAGQSVYYDVAYRDNKGRVQMLPGGYRVSPEEYEQKRIESQLAPPRATRADVGAARQSLQALRENDPWAQAPPQ